MLIMLVLLIPFIICAIIFGIIAHKITKEERNEKGSKNRGF